MKKLILIFSLLVIGLTSCQKEEIKPKEEYFFTIIEYNYLQYNGFKNAYSYVNSSLKEGIEFTAYTNDIVQVYTENSDLIIVKSEKYYDYSHLINILIMLEQPPSDVEFIIIERINTPLNPEIVYFEIMP